jgi:WhiB family transcriptional regulator, redox-sensing transcriptional regulator
MSSDRETLRWQDLAACLDVDPEIFFPERGGSSRKAKMVCHGNSNPALGPLRLPCPVRAACFRYALANREQHGVWGGCGQKQRRGAAEELGVEQRAWRKRKAS